MQSLSDKLYTTTSVVRLEQIAINQFDIPAYELMKRAGQAVFNVINRSFPQSKKILVLCGAGNNAGDGYVVAKLARESGSDVQVVSLTDPDTLRGEARQAYQDWSNIAGNSVADISMLDGVDVIVDAFLGTGLSRPLSSEWQEWITAINSHTAKRISVDIPSGLFADTGSTVGIAVKADITVCFIALKQGMFTAQAKDFCGEIILDKLSLPAAVYQQVECDARLISDIDYSLLPVRQASSHKGRFGHVLIAGGNEGMPGAVILAATAALRAGAGLVTIITRVENLQAISSAVPEAMVKVSDESTVTSLFQQDFIAGISHIAIGMGLAQDDWSLVVLEHCVALHKPMLIDADALNLLVKHELHFSSPLLLTPHPGEASRLLSTAEVIDTVAVQNDRFSAIEKVRALFASDEPCVVILKGSGTLIYDGRTMKVCNAGNAAMAAPGMGDVLSGIAVALISQGVSLPDAAELAVCLHARAADSIVHGKTRGLLASDIVAALPAVLQ